MTSITLIVTGASIRAEVNGPLTSGMVGIPVTIRYDDAWNGLIKNLVCRCGKWGADRGETRTILSIDETATVAHEVMKADMRLYLGVEGYSTDGKLVIPTTWADCGRIQYGADTGADPSADPELSIWAQLQAQIKEDTIPEETVAAAISAYLKENPLEGSDFAQNVVVDTTLTVKGAAADAKAVGDAVAKEAQARLDMEDALMELQNSAVKSVNGTTPDENGNVEIITLSAAARDLLISVLRNGVYTSDQSANITALETALGSSGDVHTHSHTSAVTKAATCTTAGVRTYTCSCGNSYTASIPATGHNYVGGVCTVCGAVESGGSGDSNETQKITFAQTGTVLAISGVENIATITQTGSVLALA